MTDASAQMDKYLTPAEVSEHLSGRITVKTLSNWRSLGGMGPDFMRLGGRILYRLSDIVAWEQFHLYRSTKEYGRKLPKETPATAR